MLRCTDNASSSSAREGAGSAIAYELAKAGVTAIAIADPQAERAGALAKTLRAAVPGCDVTTGSSASSAVDMVVNASPVGMRPDDALPGDIGRCAPIC